VVKATRPRDLEGVERVWYPVEREEFPSEETLREWMIDGVCEAIDGCRVEPDGVCPHGKPSWLLAFGLI